MLNHWLHILAIHPIKDILTILLAAGAGWCFRFGGSSHGVRFVRELGIGLTEVAGLYIWAGWTPWSIPVVGLAFAESTYFKAKGTDAKWWNWLLCGLLYSAICLPVVLACHLHIYAFFTRLIVLTPIITLWRTFQGDVQWSESGAGVWQILTLPLLLL